MPSFAVYVPILDHRPTGVGVYVFEILSRLLVRFPGLVVYTSNPEDSPSWLADATLKPCLSPVFNHTSGAKGRLSRLMWLNFHAKHAMMRDGVTALLSLVQEGAYFPHINQIVVMHDMTALRYPDAYAKAHVVFSRYYLPRSLKSCRKVICVSQSTFRDVHDFAGVDYQDMEVVYEGFERSVFYPPSIEEVNSVRALYDLPEHYFFYSGTFSSHKNLITGLQSFASVLVRYPYVRFAFCGRSDSGDFALFMNEAKRLGVDHAITMLGYVPREHLHVLLGEATAYIFPSLFEGFGLAPLEALASGAVVISSNAGSLPEVVGEGGYLLSPLDQNAWFETMLSAIERANRGDRLVSLREGAVNQAMKFCWDKAVDQMIDIINSVQ